ncbi:MAG TPA: hypothetical protein VMW32_00700 [Bacteroidales bacterium]|nr:hypothetical protein [Bacteroidales bacterium]
MMKLTYRECMEMLDALSGMDQVNPTILHVRLSYAVAKNKRKLLEIQKDLQEIIKQSEGYKKFMKEKTKLLQKHAERDDKGRPVVNIINSIEGPIENYTLKGGSAPGSPFAADLEKLKARYKKDIEERESQTMAYNEFLEKESEFEPHMVTEDLLPEKGIPQAAMNGLIYMIKEEEKKKPRGKR